jgi:rhodanese-related sulfurtransferase
VLYCRSGNRSDQAQQLLEQAGYTNVQDMGGIIDWQVQGYPISNG